jgi:hypothetical protein
MKKRSVSHITIRNEGFILEMADQDVIEISRIWFVLPPFCAIFAYKKITLK